MLAAMFIRLLHTAYQKSATYDEAFYITYGYSLLKTGDYRLSIDKPPLVPVISAIPLIFMNLKFDLNDTDWQKSKLWINSKNPWGELSTHRWNLSLKFLYKNIVNPEKILAWSRTSIGITIILLALGIFLLSKKIFGLNTALFILFFYSFSPNILAHSSLVTEDSIVTGFMFLSILGFLQLIYNLKPVPCVTTGLLTGMALLSKFSALLLFPIYGFIVMLSLIAGKVKRENLTKLLSLLGITFVIAGFLLLICYKFIDIKFYIHLIRNILIYNKRGQATYCLGNYSYSGFWYYYIICFLLKTPLSVLVLLGFTPFIFKKFSKNERTNIIIIILIIIISFIFISLNKIQLGLRHLLLVYPFVFCLVSMACTKLRYISLILCIYYMVSSVKSHPHYLAYFNEFAGGSKNGYKHLIDSNIDWGQDLKGLKKFIQEEKVSDVVLSYYGSGLEEFAGLKFQDLYSFGLWGEKKHINPPEPEKEILAVSVTNLQGLYLGKIGHDVFYWLKEKKPVTAIGHTIFVYDITRDVSFHERLANIYFFTGQYKKAFREAERTIILDKKSAAGHLILSFLYLGADQYDNAIKGYRKAIEINPKLEFLSGFITNTITRNIYRSYFVRFKEMSIRRKFPEGAKTAEMWINLLSG
jgi:4-amino-4-deoxy-L-arabinose transferase-like glycosyltransferase